MESNPTLCNEQSVIMAQALVLTRVAVAEADFRLPRAVLPTHYRLDLEPRFEDDNFTVYGQASTYFAAGHALTRFQFTRSKLQSL
jgi:hypothetical protein